MLLAPLAKPPRTCSLLSFFIFSLSFEKSLSSSTKRVIPLLIDPVMDSTVLKAPVNVFVRSDLAPRTTPFPPYNGLVSNPSAGSSTKSLNPDPIF